MIAAKDWIELLENAEDVERPEPYSGRGMLGKQCASITTGDLFATVASLAQAVADGVDEDERDGYWAMLARTRMDNMGMDNVVLYWPRATWPEAAAEEAA